MRTCFRSGGCGPYEGLSCSECPASKPSYLERLEREVKCEKAKVRKMSSIEAYQTIAKHIYEAHALYGYGSSAKQIIILADNFDEAKAKAEKVFGVRPFSVNPVDTTYDPQIYNI